MSFLMSALADVWAHDKQPVDRLLQEAHAVVRCNVSKHSDLLREALERKEKNAMRTMSSRTNHLLSSLNQCI